MLKNKEKNIAKISDQELLERIQKGEKALLEILYKRYAERVYHKCIGMTHDVEQAKDLTHDIFIKIFTKLHTFKGNSAFSLWVHSIAYNHCINYLLKKSKRIVKEIGQQSFAELTITDIEAEHNELKTLQITQLNLLMQQLSPQERGILLMRYQDELSVKEIAIALKMGESAVKMRLKRSRDKLAQLLKKMKARE